MQLNLLLIIKTKNKNIITFVKQNVVRRYYSIMLFGIKIFNIYINKNGIL